MLDRYNRIREWSYLPLAIFAVILAAFCVILVPLPVLLSTNSRTATLTFIFGGLVGVSEIASRYRDEPLHAILSPYGLIYTVSNGVLSLLSLLLIVRYEPAFPGVAKDQLLTAITAGFGSAAVMRTRLAVIKGADNKEVAIGPDIVISTILQMFDKNIDRLRAEKRKALVVEHLDKIRDFGSFSLASKYLCASLLAFQNLDDTTKNQLGAIISDYEKQTLPDDLKYLALGFVFLTIVGESHFASVVKDADKIKTTAGSTATKR